MNVPLITTFVILAAAMVLFLSERFSVDLVALMVVISLGMTHVLTPAEAFDGFSNPAVITIIAVFVMAGALEQTGVTETMGRLLLRFSGTSEARLVFLSMTSAAILSLFMNNIAVASVLLPDVSSAAARARINPSRVLMPLAFGTLLGGMATLFTSTNLVVSGVLQQTHIHRGALDGYLRGFGVFDFAPVGLPIVVVGIAYMCLYARNLLPQHSSVAERIEEPDEEESLVHLYRLHEDLFRARIPAGSRLDGRTVGESRLREDFKVSVMTVERGEHDILLVSPDTRLEVGDILLLKGSLARFLRRDTEPRLEILPAPEPDEDLVAQDIVVVEAMLSPRSTLMGQTLRQAHFRERYSMNVISIWRGQTMIRTGLGDLPLEFGDALLLRGKRDALRVLRDEPSLILLSQMEEKPPHVPARGYLALGILVATLLTAALGPFGVSEAMLGGAVVMLILGLLTMEQAYEAIEWKVVFLVAGVLPLGTAMTRTGATDLLARRLLEMVGAFGPYVVLLALLALTVFLSQVMKGAAVSVVVAPIAIQAANMLHPAVDPRSFCMAVALATSMAFVTPLGHPVNILMIGPGGYRVTDFVKVGTPLTLILFLLTLVLIPLVWPFYAVPLLSR
jgi:di/tricarboxylate transporter